MVEMRQVTNSILGRDMYQGGSTFSGVDGQLKCFIILTRFQEMMVKQKHTDIDVKFCRKIPVDKHHFVL